MPQKTHRIEYPLTSFQKRTINPSLWFRAPMPPLSPLSPRSTPIPLSPINFCSPLPYDAEPRSPTPDADADLYSHDFPVIQSDSSTRKDSVLGSTRGATRERETATILENVETSYSEPTEEHIKLEDIDLSSSYIELTRERAASKRQASPHSQGPPPSDFLLMAGMSQGTPFRYSLETNELIFLDPELDGMSEEETMEIARELNERPLPEDPDWATCWDINREAVKAKSREKFLYESLSESQHKYLNEARDDTDLVERKEQLKSIRRTRAEINYASILDIYYDQEGEQIRHRKRLAREVKRRKEDKLRRERFVDSPDVIELNSPDDALSTGSVFGLSDAEDADIQRAMWLSLQPPAK
ncbi:hypothetical protein K504DRAFT_526144 [Pleomassaria siparia CBS 279.74]|uniref:Uncharacterized protein n=1 Tax=Pleomassaria siparia CBS 279.74 TaxID=1314801 RepID=A0A6G1K9I5_9PLEO|nr:hypothetical protein K504DRAFT_526144 [Pleomassaria siparia CBS 279.74]